MDHSPGTHLLIDLYGARHLTDTDRLRTALTGAARAAGATVLSDHFHGFPDRGGVTGVVLLAESHISIHTWPEIGFAAVDIFMCGRTDARAAAAHLQQALAPSDTRVTEVQRNQASQPWL
ncbi:hypothetical protein ATO6_04390 [Oceanicola sp. 22II-s10i]|uniref:adenosylmethionine decarboxylase n=1 Tax=Oceanicola sp. 22II-s10i TaxID=1317116 RepID=UPI000B526FE6|nr:adenosylmethionine decarboxylase [Oceanicola sp. 22II-s10i]OWU86104.1 hypothetical protein ATO6_04390 [Oceanicola sp. 22II-s10i]